MWNVIRQSWLEQCLLAAEWHRLVRDSGYPVTRLSARLHLVAPKGFNLGYEPSTLDIPARILARAAA